MFKHLIQGGKKRKCVEEAGTQKNTYVLSIYLKFIGEYDFTLTNETRLLTYLK